MELWGFDSLSGCYALDNLVALCKNHHYEFDRGDLTLEG
jgi:predicted restriction endonuclease